MIFRNTRTLATTLDVEYVTHTLQREPFRIYAVNARNRTPPTDCCIGCINVPLTKLRLAVKPIGSKDQTPLRYTLHNVRIENACDTHGKKTFEKKKNDIFVMRITIYYVANNDFWSVVGKKNFANIRFHFVFLHVGIMIIIIDIVKVLKLKVLWILNNNKFS